MPFTARSLTLAMILWVVVATPAAAQDPNQGAQIVVQNNQQIAPQVVTDGAGGAIVVWQDVRNNANYDVYAQRIDHLGNLLWNTSGVPVCTAPADQDGIRATSDGQGGVVIAWRDPRSGSPDIYAQRLNANGQTLWAFNGVPICQAANVQDSPDLASDGSGGAILTWQDFRSNEYDIYAQRIGASGSTQWTVNGVNLTQNGSYQQLPTIVRDNAGGCIVAWQDSRNGTSDIYAQRLNSFGVTQWQFNGIEVSAVSGEQRNARIVEDGSGGAIFAWEDYRNGPAHIYCQRLNSGGVGLWTINGVGVLTSASGGIAPRAASDGAGGVIICWQDSRNGASNYDIYAQRVPSGGIPAWTGNGIAVCAVSGNQQVPQLVRNGAGGAVVTWHDDRNASNNSDIHAQSVDASGTLLWSTEGEVLCSAPSYQTFPAITEDGSGGGIVAWQDYRYATAIDIFAQRIATSRQLVFPDAEHPSLVSVRDTPNDQGGQVKLSWRGSNRDLPPIADVAEYRIWRSVPPNQVAGRAGNRIMTRTNSSSGPIYWEYLDSQPAGRLPGYSYVAATTSDSLPDSNPYTAFMIEARTANGAAWWYSNPDSGYSVDNLAPEALSGLAGTYAAGSGVSMHWRPNRDADLAHYVIHRGTSAGFVPGPENEIGTTTDTSFVDGAGSFNYYKVAAVDVHFNRGAFATLASEDIPVSTLLNLFEAEGQASAVRIRVRLADAAQAMTLRILRATSPDLGLTKEVVPTSTRIEGSERTFVDGTVDVGQTYWYWIELSDNSGAAAIAGPISASVSGVAVTAVGRAYPNPARSSVAITYAIGSDVAAGAAAHVSLKIYDPRGRVVRTLVGRNQGQGEHEAVWDGSDETGRQLSPGVYFWRFQAGDVVQKGSFVLIQ